MSWSRPFMSHSGVVSEQTTSGACASQVADGARARCPSPTDGMATVTTDLCTVLEATGCPLARPVRDRLHFEDLLAELSAVFINLPPGQVDLAIESALQRIIEHLGVDCGSLAQALERPRRLVITHSFRLPGAPPQPLGTLDEQLPWYVRTIYSGQALRLETLPDDLPGEADAEREYCARCGVKSHVMIPLTTAGSIVGAIGFASFRASRRWSDELVQRLRLLGEILTNALARKRADTILGESEARFRLMAEAAPVMVWTSGLD